MVTDSEAVAQPAAAAPSARRSLPWGPMVTVAAVVAALSAVVGALGGWLWYQWWGPPNSGSIYPTTDGPKWYDLTDKGIGHQFNGPAEYAIIAVGLGLLLGIVGAILGRRHTVAALAGLVVGSALAAYLSWTVGTTLSPPDPEKYATEANVCQQQPCKEYDAAIEVSGWTPLLSWPIGALGGLSVSIVLGSWIGDFRRAQSSRREAGHWLDAQRPD